MDKDSFIVHVKTDDFHKDITKDVETKSGTSNYELGKPLPKAKNKKVIGLMKKKSGEKIMKKFVGLRTKTTTTMKKKKQKAQKVCH